MASWPSMRLSDVMLWYSFHILLIDYFVSLFSMFWVVLAYEPGSLRAPDTKSAKSVFWLIMARSAVQIFPRLDNFDPAFSDPTQLGPLGLTRASPVGSYTNTTFWGLKSLRVNSFYIFFRDKFNIVSFWVTILLD